MDNDEGIIMKCAIDLGDNHWMLFTSWRPDRALNPQYKDLPDVERYGAIVKHLKPNGKACVSGITFRSVVAVALEGEGRPMWTVESWEPLTLSPSLLCRACGDHGFIRNGRWVKA